MGQEVQAHRLDLLDAHQQWLSFAALGGFVDLLDRIARQVEVADGSFHDALEHGDVLTMVARPVPSRSRSAAKRSTTLGRS